MKNRLTFMLLFISVIACKAQSPIIDIEKKPYFTRTQENAYYKDINNFYNDLVNVIKLLKHITFHHNHQKKFLFCLIKC